MFVTILKTVSGISFLLGFSSSLSCPHLSLKPLHCHWWHPANENKLYYLAVGPFEFYVEDSSLEYLWLHCTPAPLNSPSSLSLFFSIFSSIWHKWIWSLHPQPWFVPPSFPLSLSLLSTAIHLKHVVLQVHIPHPVIPVSPALAVPMPAELILPLISPCSLDRSHHWPLTQSHPEFSFICIELSTGMYCVPDTYHVQCQGPGMHQWTRKTV